VEAPHECGHPDPHAACDGSLPEVTAAGVLTPEDRVTLVDYLPRTVEISKWHSCPESACSARPGKTGQEHSFGQQSVQLHAAGAEYIGLRKVGRLPIAAR
jgi:hypothetical protein